jgi:transposase
MVSARSREVARCPSGACAAWRPDAARRHDGTIVEPHPGVLKTFGLLPGAMRGLPFDRRVEELLVDRDELVPIVRPMLIAWRRVREQIAAFDKAVRALARTSPACRLLMGVPGIGVVSVFYVSTVENPARFTRSRSVGAHMGLTPRQYQSGEIDRSGRISRCETRLRAR